MACGGPATPDEVPTETETKSELSTDEAKAIAKEAYLFGFPMMMNYKTLYEYTLNKESGQYRGPFNTVKCGARLYTPDDTAIVTPNSDTPYCMGWLDLSSGPIVVSVPEMEENRFYHVQLTDWYTHNFAYIGTRTNNNKAGKYLVVGPGWEGDKTGYDAVLASETNFVFTIIRTQLFGQDDLKRVEEIQAQYKFEPLNEAAEANPIPAPMAWTNGVEFTPQALNVIDFTLDFAAQHPDDAAIWTNLKKLGLGTDATFDVSKLDPEIAAAVADGVKEAQVEAKTFISTQAKDPLVSGKIFGTRAFLTDTSTLDASASLKRTAGAIAGLYGNSGEEALYPTYFVDATGAPLDAGNANYTITFPSGQLPPAKAFWSLSMYDGKTQLFIHNPLNRYLVNSSMLKSMKKNKDGSLTIQIQNTKPESGDTNWLPAPKGPFYLVLRVYDPDPMVFEGKWTPPQVVKAE